MKYLKVALTTLVIVSLVMYGLGFAFFGANPREWDMWLKMSSMMYVIAIPLLTTYVYLLNDELPKSYK